MNNILVSHKITTKEDINQLKEDNIMYFYEDNNGDGIFYYKTANGYEIYYYEEYTLSSFINVFPELKKIKNIIWDNDRTSYKGYDGKYKCIYAGHGTTLCIDKNIYKDYVKYCEIHNKQNHTGFVDAYSTFEKMCIDITNETYITN